MSAIIIIFALSCATNPHNGKIIKWTGIGGGGEWQNRYQSKLCVKFSATYRRRRSLNCLLGWWTGMSHLKGRQRTHRHGVLRQRGWEYAFELLFKLFYNHSLQSLLHPFSMQMLISVVREWQHLHQEWLILRPEDDFCGREDLGIGNLSNDPSFPRPDNSEEMRSTENGNNG